MADQFVAEIRVFPFNFAPTGWAQCNGQLMAISQNTALFSLLGTTYGGDGRTNFALPNLQGQVPVAAGQGAGLSLYSLGQNGGQSTVTVLQTQMPAHNHGANCNSAAGTSYDPTSNVWAVEAGGNNEYGSGAAAGNLSPLAISPAGGGQPHNNLQPFLTLNFCIALQGIFPPRS